MISVQFPFTHKQRDTLESDSDTTNAIDQAFDKKYDTMSKRTKALFIPWQIHRRNMHLIHPRK